MSTDFVSQGEFAGFRSEVRHFIQEGSRVFEQFRALLERQSGERAEFRFLAESHAETKAKAATLEKEITNLKGELREWRARILTAAALLQVAVAVLVWVLTKGKDILAWLAK